MDVHALPHGDGYTRHYDLDTGFDHVPMRALKFAPRVQSLTPFLERFAFFTPAPAYLWGSLHPRVLADFLAQQQGTVEFFHRKFERPLFRGLEAPNGDVAWNHVLWAVERPHWQPLVDHLCAAVLTDSPRQVVYRFGLQNLEIVDPLFLDRRVLCPAVLPSLAIGAFGVRSSAFTAAFQEGAANVLDLPRIVFLPPAEECRLYARVLFQHDPVQAALSLTPKDAHDRSLSQGSGSGAETGSGGK
jgi:hypothetical protein